MLYVKYTSHSKLTGFIPEDRIYPQNEGLYNYVLEQVELPSVKSCSSVSISSTPSMITALSGLTSI